MVDWNNKIRRRLASLTLELAREAEIVEELACRLEDRYTELRACGANHEESNRAVLAESSESEQSVIANPGSESGI